MPSDVPGFDLGLLSPVTAGHDDLVSDRLFLDALVSAEVALVEAYGTIGLAPAEAVAAIREEFRADRGIRPSSGIDAAALATDAVAGGNPVIPLVGVMKARVPADAREWVHRGATSQDIWDSAIMIVAKRAVEQVSRSVRNAQEWLLQLAERHRDDVVVARTLTQHAVPTTFALRAVNWQRGLRRAAARLDALEFPAQLSGAGGTLASFVEVAGSPAQAEQLVASFAEHAGLDAPDGPWHVLRHPVTEIGDVLVQAVDALGKLAADVATLSRTEIGEVAEGIGGGSSAMPQKQNPAEAVLIRSAALRAPQLGATLHLASALAVDERPDGAWHAEWPTLRELLRLALGAAWHAASLTAHLRVDAVAAAAHLDDTGGLVLAERLSLVLGPRVGREEVAELVARAGAGEDLADLVRGLIVRHDLDLDAGTLLDPAGYTGLADALVDRALHADRRIAAPREEDA